MKEPIIRASNLSKCYRIGVAEKGYKTFREAITGGITAPLRNFYKLRKLTKFKSNLSSGDDEDMIWALKNVVFEVREGEVLGIIGRNGAGKSTLLKVLSRITEPTTGYVEIAGRLSSLLEIGVGFHPELTGRENIFLNGAILGMRKWEIKERFDEVVDFSEIGKFIDTPLKRYSSGMYVRLAFAVAAHLEPEILVIDEVLAVGDIPFQKKCIGKMQDIAKGGRTVLFVSHNMEVIKKLCTRAIVLHEGKIIMDGPVDEAINKCLGDEMGLDGEQIWTEIKKAPGDAVVRMCAVRVLDSSGKVCTNFDVRDSVSVQIECKVLENGHRLIAHLSFINELGHILFVSKYALDSLSENSTSPQGGYRITCHIPGDFLNEGDVSIAYGIDTIGVGNSHLIHVAGSDVVRFRISDRMDPAGVRGDFPSKWPSDGVRPRLQWEIGKTN